MIRADTWWLWSSPVDLRKNIDSLAMLVMEQFEGGLQKRAAYVFCNRSGRRIKVLLWDGLGFWLCLRRLERGRFMLPSSSDVCELNAEQFTWLSAGLDWKRWDETLQNPVWL